MLVGAAFSALLWGCASLLPPRNDEPLPLRWARLAALHPIRTALGAGCLALGLLGASALGRKPPTG